MKNCVLFSCSLVFSLAASAEPIFSNAPFELPRIKILPPTPEAFLAQPKIVFQEILPEAEEIGAGLLRRRYGLPEETPAYFAVYKNPRDEAFMLLGCEEIDKIRTQVLINLVKSRSATDQKNLQGKMDELGTGKKILSCKSKWSGTNFPAMATFMPNPQPVATPDRMRLAAVPFF
jgi:hypothetical protein